MRPYSAACLQQDHTTVHLEPVSPQGQALAEGLGPFTSFDPLSNALFPKGSIFWGKQRMAMFGCHLAHSRWGRKSPQTYLRSCSVATAQTKSLVCRAQPLLIKDCLPFVPGRWHVSVRTPHEGIPVFDISLQRLTAENVTFHLALFS